MAFGMTVGEWHDYVECDMCRALKKLIQLESAPFLQF